MTLGDRVYPVEEVTVDSVNRIVEDINNILGGLSGGITTTTVSGTINDGSLPPNVPSGVAYPSSSPPYNPDGTPPIGRDFDRHHLGRRDVQPVKDLTTTAFMNAVQFTWGAIENVVGYGYRFKVGSGNWEDWQTTKIPYAIRHLSESESSANPSGATIAIQVLALYEVNGKFLAAQACEGSNTTDILYVSPSSITDFEQISNAFPNIPVVVGATFTNNSPGAGQVAWNAHSLWYAGTEYSISASNTGVSSSSDAIYIWWDNGDSAYTTTAAGTHPAASMGIDDFIIAVNVNGTHTLAWNAIANQVIGSAYIQKASIVDLHVDTISAAKLTAGTVMTAGVTIGPVSTAAVSAAGLYITDSYIGYYNGSTWATSTYWKNDGSFRLTGDANNYVMWNGSALDVYTKGGAINCGNGTDLNLDSTTGDIAYIRFKWGGTTLSSMHTSATSTVLMGTSNYDVSLNSQGTGDFDINSQDDIGLYATDVLELSGNTISMSGALTSDSSMSITSLTTSGGITLGNAITNSVGASTLYQLSVGAGGLACSGATVLGGTSVNAFSCGLISSDLNCNDNNGDIGDATYYWNDVHCVDVVDYSIGLPLDANGIDILKGLKRGTRLDRNGNPKWDNRTLPRWATSYDSLRKQIAEDDPEMTDEEFDRALSDNRTKISKMLGGSMGAKISILIDAVIRLNQRVEALEGGV